ncbi:Lar family restriction alleviation protein [Lelliottia amnigena]|uniref:Lar family restriction alleviation protein n=1 Tax=Lelliottia amnigena TaxID=61646 RepID=UPI00293BDAC7|nr:hypothetical protein [Lelliottia amnigena]
MTLTKSWLQKQITDLEATRDEIPFGLDEDGNNTLAALKLALAGMEAEPVINRQSICNKVHDKCSRLPGATFYNAAEFALDEICAAPQPATVVIGSNGLLPCPFCGGEPEEDAGGCSEYSGHEHQDYSISCNGCGAEVYCAVGSFEKADVPCSCHHDTRTVCVNKWNRRAAMLQGGKS